MTDTDDFVAEFLEHRGSYDADKAREYYLRTRKLVGRKARDFTETKTVNVGSVGAYTRSNGNYQEGDLTFQKNKRRFRPDTNSSKFVPDTKTAAREERVAVQQAKIDRAREKAKKLSPEKRSGLEKKLDLIESRLKKANPFAMRFGGKSKTKRKLNTKNPFAGIKVSRD